MIGLSQLGSIRDEVEHAWAVHTRPRITRGPFLTADLRSKLAEETDHRCGRCGVPMTGKGSEPDAPTFTCIIPVSRGGVRDLGNIAIACVACNKERDRALAVAKQNHRRNGARRKSN
jgi:hypothetical protein